ncbi:MAG: chromate transporter [Lachnospiraceae bacterium]|nr:chromate transporter [Lachnospiraceae bacterium]
MNILCELFLTFAQIGLFTFGGGYAMISIIENICVEKKKWISHDDMMNVTVIAESTPGPISINCATFVGFRQAGICGALAATLGVVIPSFVIIFAISMFLDNFLKISIIANAFQGIKIAVGILILNAAYNMLKKMQRGILANIFVICSFSAMFFTNIFSWRFSSISLMFIAAIISLSVFAIIDMTKSKGGVGK